MKSCDVIGYTHQDGYILCEECGWDQDPACVAEDSAVHPIFAAELATFAGNGCEICRRVLTEDGDWVEMDDRDDGEPSWDDEYDARSALASAGFGTDEDYNFGCGSFDRDEY